MYKSDKFGHICLAKFLIPSQPISELSELKNNYLTKRNNLIQKVFLYWK
jgi:hypothetical protein